MNVPYFSEINKYFQNQIHLHFLLDNHSILNINASFFEYKNLILGNLRLIAMDFETLFLAVLYSTEKSFPQPGPQQFLVCHLRKLHQNNYPH